MINKVHEIKGYIQSIYLVERDEGMLLLDGCSRVDVETVKDFIEQKLNRSITELKLVIATHPHPDHFGGVSFFKKKYGVKITGPKEINEWYSGPRGYITYWVDILLTYLVAVNKKRGIKNIVFPRKADFDFYLSDNDPIPGFSDWRALKCSGHTDMDLSIYCADFKLAYIADNFVGKKGKVFRPYPLMKPMEYRKSLERYLNLGIEEFLIAHHGKLKITKKEIEELIYSTPNESRRHASTLPKILIKLLKAVFKR